MGAGKSAVGSRLKEKAGFDRFDTDEMVEAKLNMSISQIFAQHGEERFREVETETLREVAIDQPAIIVTGGGIVLRQENVDLLQRLGMVVWLDADEEILFDRAAQKGNRPLLETENRRETFSQMLQARRPVYAKIANVRIDTSALSADEVADTILKLLEAHDR